ncbi:MAG: phosphotransferase [Sphaerobacter sp.]|nr:phosphotransferase [Sphaerobacter sp.]
MREPPVTLADETLRACLRDRYGLAATEVTFLPLGYDASAWVYRVRAADGATYFLKARLSLANEAGLLVPRYLRDHGVARVVAPLPTRTGELWTDAGNAVLILYPFVAGTAARDCGMTAEQWVAYGALLRQVHDTAITPDLARVLRRDAFLPEWAAMVRRLDVHIGTRTFDDPTERLLADFWRQRRGEIRTLVDRAEALGRRLADAAPAQVLCHADIHTANVLVDTAGQVWFVDWDETLLAPRERDLMFVVGGISSTLVGPQDEARFFEGYGATAVDPVALAYYRYSWAVGDIGSFGEQVFFRADCGPAAKREAAELLMGVFSPGEIVALAFASEEAAG